MMAVPTSVTSVISTRPELEAFLSSIPPSSTLYLDLEGQQLCRHGTISLMTVLLHPQGVVKLIDVLSLGESAFTTTSTDGKSLKSILEDPNITKCFWDVRNDADALWALYNVGLSGVIDIQLLENASRFGDKTYLNGLERAVRQSLALGRVELDRFTASKRETTSLMSSNVFDIRPMDPKTVQYCTNDVVYLPALHQFYLRRLSPAWLEKAKLESLRRVEVAHSPGYEPRSPSKRLGPWGSGMTPRIMMSIR
ncbi:ribonuclease H-like domain-containing protein [Cladorrhinum samala]|uniref:Ribonuclease H-like domain-containing protein n=1 Tax=Cladorrhinum samala TaxID=585594 RepID=A0AAV9HUY4_9PEZI|nr:ribonuclease H-like domain-containing protein [Cladorrhinum samala]